MLQVGKLVLLVFAGDGRGCLQGPDGAGAWGYECCKAGEQTAGFADCHPKRRAQMSGGESTPPPVPEQCQRENGIDEIVAKSCAFTSQSIM